MSKGPKNVGQLAMETAADIVGEAVGAVVVDSVGTVAGQAAVDAVEGALANAMEGAVGELGEVAVDNGIDMGCNYVERKVVRGGVEMVAGTEVADEFEEERTIADGITMTHRMTIKK